MKKNDKFNAIVDNLGMNGEGVARIDNQVVFVPFVLPKEQVEGIVINDKSSFLIGKAVNIKDYNKYRVEPKCPYFTRCGGCNLQHLDYEQQLKFKTELVKDTLKKVGNIEFKVEECVASNKEYNYRNKASFPVAKVLNKTQIGMFRNGTHNLVEIDYCPLQKTKINKLIEITKQFIEKYNIQGYNEKTKTGILKHLVARELQNSLLITLVATTNKIPNLKEYIKMLSDNFESFGLNININKLNNNVILSNKFEHVYGLKYLNCENNGIKFPISSASFYQVNDFIKDEIYNKVLNFIDENTVVIDAYSGAGLLSSLISKKAKWVYGIEIVQQATENADVLKQVNNITNLTNINGDCEVKLPEIIKQINNSVIVVLDPPRKGCDRNVLETIKNNNVEKIIYISCSPISLARDLKILLDNTNYQINLVQPFDMFPQTKNVETLVVLNKG